MTSNQSKYALTAALALMLFSGGCVTPGNDPVVVQAERATELSLDVFDSFLRWEYANQETVGCDVKQAADRIRRDGTRWLESARALTKAYKQNRTPKNKANLDTALWVLQISVEEAISYMPKP